MNKPDQLLNSLLDKARSQQELVSVESVHALTKTLKPIPKPFNYTAMTILTSTLISSAAAIYWFAAGSGNTPATAVPAATNNTGIEVPAKIQPLTGKTPQTPFVTEEHPAAAVESAAGMPEIPFLLPVPETVPVIPPIVPFVNMSKMTIPAAVKDEAPYIRLTDQQLLKLGIVYKEGVLVYKAEKTCLNDVSLYMSPSSVRINVGGNTAIPTNPVAWFVTDNKGIIIQVIYNDKEKQFSDKAADLLPVMVDDGTNKQYILWFENEKLFTSLMPEDIQQNLRSNSHYYSHVLPAQPTERERREPEIVRNSMDTTSVPSFYPGQLVIADAQLMKKLGISAQNKGYIFKRSFDGRTFEINASDDNLMFNQDNRSESSGNKMPETIKQVVPGFITASRFYMNRHLMCLESMAHKQDISTSQFFLNNRHQYVVIQMPVDHDLRYFWYKPTPALMEYLSVTDRAKVEGFLANPPQQKAEINTVTPPQPDYLKIFDKEEQTTVIEGVRTLVLTPEQLQKLRISITENNDVAFMVHGGNYDFIPFVIGKNGVMVNEDSDHHLQNRQKDTINPELITDDLGKAARISFNQPSSEVNTSKLIPVLVRSGAEYTAIDKLQQRWRPDLIFWYKPTEQFLSLMTQVIASEIRNDLAVIESKTVKNSEAVKPGESPAADTAHAATCKYFELCRNVKGVIGEHNIYPNPAQQSTTVSFTLAEAARVTITLTDINGKKLLQTIQNAEGNAANAVNIPLAGLEAGMYLVYIESDKGDYIYERIIVTK